MVYAFKLNFILVSQKGMNFRLMCGSFTVLLSLWRKQNLLMFFQGSSKLVAICDGKNQTLQENQEEVAVSKHSQHDEAEKGLDTYSALNTTHHLAGQRWHKQVRSHKLRKTYQV